MKAGVIDPDYRGRIQVILHNFGHKSFHINKHDRIAQIIIKKFASPTIQISDKIDSTLRSTKGLGSTGISTPTPKIPIVPNYTTTGSCGKSMYFPLSFSISFF